VKGSANGRSAREAPRAQARDKRRRGDRTEATKVCTLNALARGWRLARRSGEQTLKNKRRRGAQHAAGARGHGERARPRQRQREAGVLLGCGRVTATEGMGVTGLLRRLRLELKCDCERWISGVRPAARTSGDGFGVLEAAHRRHALAGARES